MKAGKYTFVVTDASNEQSFTLVGPGVSKVTPVKGTGKTTWNLDLKAGKYMYSSPARPGSKKTFRVA